MPFSPQQPCDTHIRGSPCNLFQSTASLGSSKILHFLRKVFYETTVCGKRRARLDRKVEILDPHILNSINPQETILLTSRLIRNMNSWIEEKSYIV